MDELTQKVQEYINQEIERRVREITVHLSSESIVKKLEELIRENEILRGQRNLGIDKLTVIGPGTIWKYDPGPTCTDFTRDDHDLLKKYSKRGTI